PHMSTADTIRTFSCLFFNVPAPTAFYTLSLHDALPISLRRLARCPLARPSRRHWLHAQCRAALASSRHARLHRAHVSLPHAPERDRKSTRLNSSHVSISYAVFCLKKKKKQRTRMIFSYY